MNTSSPQREPAYLRGNADWRILADGPALRVRQPRRSDQLLPLRRIRRIHSQGPIRWESAALLACARAGVPVHFCNREGELLGRFLPPMPPKPATLGEQIDLALGSVNRARSLHRWLEAQRRIQHNRLPPKPAGEHGPPREARALSLLPHCARGPLRRAWRQLESLIRCDLEQRLIGQGWDPANSDGALHGIDLPSELAALLLDRLFPRCLDAFGALPKPDHGRIKPRFHQTVEMHHRLARSIERQTDQLLFELHRHLIDSVEERNP